MRLCSTTLTTFLPNLASPLAIVATASTTMMGNADTSSSPPTTGANDGRSRQCNGGRTCSSHKPVLASFQVVDVVDVVDIVDVVLSRVDLCLKISPSAQKPNT